MSTGPDITTNVSIKNIKKGWKEGDSECENDDCKQMIEDCFVLSSKMVPEEI